MSENSETIMFNQTPRSGKFSDVAASIDANFDLAKIAILNMKGKSAYEIWKDQDGNENKTVQEFLASLKESGYGSQAVSTRPTTNISTTTIYAIAGTSTWTEEIYDGTNWLVLATHEGGLTDLIEKTPTIASSQGEPDLSIVDENSNAIVKFEGGHIKTKEFDSSKAVTREEQRANLQALAETIPDTNTLPQVGNDDDADLSIVDDNNNAIIKIKDGHIKTKNFNSKDMSKLVPIWDGRADLDIRDEKGNILVKFERGHVKTQNFDSENIMASSNNLVEYPQFMGYGIDDSTGEKTASLVHLTSTWVRATKDDLVEVADASRINGFKVYEYKSINGQLLAKSSSFSTAKYKVQNSGTAFIRILGVKDGTTTLYTNADFRGNIFVTHVNPINPSDDNLQLNSTIPDGWYVSQQTEFPKAVIDRGNGETDNVIPIAELYAEYDNLYSSYGVNGTDPVSKGYITREQLGMDETNTYQLWRYVFEPTPVDVVAQKEYKTSGVTTGYDYGKSRGVFNDSLPTICLEACLHGSERPCSRALLNFLIHLCRDWAEDKFLEWIRWNVRLVVIPIANPWGYVNHARGNVNHVDLNRNFNGNGGWAQFADKGSSALDYKGTAPYSEAETRLIARNMLENADAIAYYDLHTHGVYGAWEVQTRFDYGNDVFLGNVLSSVGIELTKGFTISGMKNHGMADALYDDNGTMKTVYTKYPFKYFGQVGCAAGNVPYISNQGVEIGLPASSPEVTYLRRYFDTILPKSYYVNGATGNAGCYNGTHYNEYTDCWNEEYVVNLVLMTIRQRFIQSKK